MLRLGRGLELTERFLYSPFFIVTRLLFVIANSSYSECIKGYRQIGSQGISDIFSINKHWEVGFYLISQFRSPKYEMEIYGIWHIFVDFPVEFIN